MKTVFLFVKLFFYILPVMITALRCRKEPFAVRCEVVRHWCQIIVKASGMRVTAKGMEQIPKDKTIYFLSNHQGTLDPVIFYSYVPVPAVIVSKEENRKMPVASMWMKTLNTIFFDRSSLRSSLQMVKDVQATLEKGTSVLLFPEGTRSRGPKMNEFKAGGLKPAFPAQAIIVPVAMKNTYQIDQKGKINKPVSIAFLKPITYEEYKDLSTVELADQVQQRIQKQLEE